MVCKRGKCGKPATGLHGRRITHISERDKAIKTGFAKFGNGKKGTRKYNGNTESKIDFTLF